MAFVNKWQPGISVIVSTKRPHFLEKMFHNYRRQIWAKKELIVVVNKDSVDMSRYRQMARRLPHIRVFHLPASRFTLGRCLNFATKRAVYPIIAKMDDDEYYAPLYLAGMIDEFRRSNADIVGKQAYYMYLRGSGILLRRFNKMNRFVRVVSGGTLTFKRTVWQKVKFRNVRISEDVIFCKDAHRAGFRIYSGNLFNFCAIRRKNPKSHTWQVNDWEFITEPHSKIIARTTDFRQFVIAR
ncbi:MAG TPA: glycosyltransferase [Bacilli bacterium]